MWVMALVVVVVIGTVLWQFRYIIFGVLCGLVVVFLGIRSYFVYLSIVDRRLQTRSLWLETEQKRRNLEYIPQEYGAVWVAPNEIRELVELKKSAPKTVHHHYAEDGALPGDAARIIEAIPQEPIPVYAQVVEAEVTAGHICLGVMSGSDGKWSKYIWGDISDLISTAVVGIPGTGKSTLLRFVVAQLIKVGGSVVVWDPHGSIAREMSGFFPCYDGPEEIGKSAFEMLAELERRRKLYKAQQLLGDPLLIVIDEWLLISDCPGAAGKAINRAVREVVLEGRKFGMYILLAGQSLPAASFKESGTAVSRAFVTRYVFNVNRMHAIQVGIPAEEAKRLLPVIEFAGVGVAIISSGRLGVRPRIVAIPTTVTSDIRAALLSDYRGVKTIAAPTPRVGYLVENGQYVKDPDYEPPAQLEVDKQSGGLVPDLSQAPPLLPDDDIHAGYLTEEDKEKLIEWEIQGIARRYMPRLLGKGARIYNELKAFLDSQNGKPDE